MKVRFALKTLVLIFPLSLSVYAQFTQTAYSQNNPDSQEISRAIAEVGRAFVSRDPTPFDRLYLDGYVNVREKPVFNYREQLSAMVKWDAAAIKAGKKLEFETLSYESDLPAIQIFGEAAIVNVLKKNLWRYREDRCLTQYQTTELWIKADSAWKIAVNEYSGMNASAFVSLRSPASLSLVKSSRSSVSTDTEMNLEGFETARISATAGCGGCHGIWSH